MAENPETDGGPPSPEIIGQFTNNQDTEIEQLILGILDGSEISDDPLDLSYLSSGDPELDSLVTLLQHAANGTGPMQHDTPSDQTDLSQVRRTEPGEPQSNATSAQQVPGNGNSEVQSTTDENSGEEERDASGDQSSGTASSTPSLKRKREDDDPDHQVEGTSATAGTTGETSFANLLSPHYTVFGDDANNNQDESQGLNQGHCLDQDANTRGPKRPRRDGSPKPTFHSDKPN